MSKTYEGPAEIRPLEKLMCDFTFKSGHDLLSVFDSLLDYIIHFFNPLKTPLEHWKYTPEQTRKFHEMMVEYFRIMQHQTAVTGWYDAFGELFMSLISTSSAQYRGQFFTPPSVCEACIQFILGDEEKQPSTDCGGFGMRVAISDPACGSSRMLLAAHNQYILKNRKKPYLIGEDIDHICCKMSAINLCAHGCFGEVVCHNTLEEPDRVNIGYKVNETMYPFPALPSIRILSDETMFVSCGLYKERKKETSEDTVINEQKEEIRQSAQLSLF